jgi:hypothetical protein
MNFRAFLETGTFLEEGAGNLSILPAPWLKHVVSNFAMGGESSEIVKLGSFVGREGKSFGSLTKLLDTSIGKRVIAFYLTQDKEPALLLLYDPNKSYEKSLKFRLIYSDGKFEQATDTKYIRVRKQYRDDSGRVRSYAGHEPRKWTRSELKLAEVSAAIGPGKWDVYAITVDESRLATRDARKAARAGRDSDLEAFEKEAVKKLVLKRMGSHLDTTIKDLKKECDDLNKVVDAMIDSAFAGKFSSGEFNSVLKRIEEKVAPLKDLLWSIDRTFSYMGEVVKKKKDWDTDETVGAQLNSRIKELLAKFK